jgi:dihydroorotate dehydrogenase (fumarate)
MADLSVSYMGIKLKNPVIAGASGLTANMDTIKSIEQAGAGAIVCKSLFEEEIQLELLKQQKDLHKYDDWHAEMITIFPNLEAAGPENHLYWVKKTKQAVSIPVFASLNAVTEEIWIEYARLLEKTGIDGLELNFYSSPAYQLEAAAAIEKKQIEVLTKIRRAIDIPISVKLSPYYTNIVKFISELDRIGIDGFVLFNRFFQSSIDINKQEITFPFTFSHKEDNRLPLRFAGLLHGNIKGTICCSTGILDFDDVASLLLAGADAVQVVSTLFKNGITHLRSIIDGIERWMGKMGYSCINDFKGKLSRKKLEQKDTWIYKRTQYVKMLMQSGEALMKQIL